MCDARQWGNVEGDDCRRRKCKSSIYALAHCHVYTCMRMYERTHMHCVCIYTRKICRFTYIVYSICMYVHIGLHIDLACISRDEAWTMMHGRSACVRKHSVSFPSTIFFSWPDFYQCFIDRVIRNEKVRPNSDADSAEPPWSYTCTTINWRGSVRVMHCARGIYRRQCCTPLAHI